MNLTKYRDNLIGFISPVSTILARVGITPNQITFLSLLFGAASGALYGLQYVYLAAALLMVSSLLDFVDGGVARINKKASRFGAAIDWIVDKYVDCFVLLGIGFSGFVDFRITAIAVFGSMMNTFIKPVVYAEIGFESKGDGKIKDPLEGIGIFGRPETIITIIVASLLSSFSLYGYSALTLGILLVAAGTNLSALQRIYYLYRRREKY